MRARPAGPPQSELPNAEGSAPEYVCANESVLFEEEEAVKCDACGAELAGAEDDLEPYEVRGEGVYMWSRGEGDVRFERAPLCASCAAAIGVSALARWEIEEEEG